MRNQELTICPLCHKKTSQNLHGMTNYLYCERCDIAWVKKHPKIVYNETYYGGTSNIAGKAFSPLSILFYKIRNSFAGNKYPQRWIDVGAGDGNYLEYVKAKERIGVEISASGRDHMKKKGLKTMTEKEFLKAKNLKADVISFWHVLEHVDKPWEYIEAAQRNIKSHGKIIIGVPNHRSLEFKIFGKYWFHLVPDFHLWHYSPKSLETFLTKAGLKIQTSDYWSLEHHLTGVLQSFINRTAKSDSVLHRIIKRRQDFSKLNAKDIFWVAFWCTVGLPIVVLFWITGAIMHRSGTFIVVASKR